MCIRAAIYWLLFVPTIAMAQEELVDLSMISFHSELEKNVLTDHFRKAKTDNFLMLMAPGTLLNDAKVSEARKTFYAGLMPYKDEKFKSKKPDKKIKQIHDDLHKRFLKKLQFGSAFEEIFYNGNYDNLTASALFALAFEELEIPYVIKEEPGNIFILAYPDAERVRVEASSANQFFHVISDAFKQQYVNSLREQKVISVQEAASQSVSILFDKYYYGNQTNITLLNLLGLSYLATAQTHGDSHNFEAAHPLAEKAYLLYPSSKTAYTLLAAGSQAFAARKEIDSIRAVQLAKLSRLESHGISDDVIRDEFARVINILLFEKGRRTDLEMFHRVLVNRVINPSLQSELDFLFYYETGRYLYNQAKFKDALPFFEKALSLKPEKQDASNALISTIANTMSNTSDNLQIVNLFEDYSKRFPVLHDNNLFNQALMATYLIQIAMEYDLNDQKDGEKYRALFELAKGKFPEATADPTLVSQAYSRAAIFFYRKGQTAKARNILDIGLKFAPNSYELMSRKRMIN
jgi:tetratricopeptide (TPR) repeat protein